LEMICEGPDISFTSQSFARAVGQRKDKQKFIMFVLSGHIRKPNEMTSRFHVIFIV